MEQIHNYRGKSRSLSNSQILLEDYDVDNARIVMKEMVENLVLELVENNLYAKGISLFIRYSKDCTPATGGAMKLEQTTCSIRRIQAAFDKLTRNNALRQTSYSYALIPPHLGAVRFIKDYSKKVLGNPIDYNKNSFT